MSQMPPIIRQSGNGPEKVSHPVGPALRSCEAKLLACIRDEWAVEYGSREVRLVIEYQDRTPVLIRVTMNTVTEEKLR
ncbi:MAG TPA: hypothetical protein VFM04_00645 [Candidatus Methylomirabilis sp.]|nr:hypothetical protein [Candidatus Methylomirabilis sp.]